MQFLGLLAFSSSRIARALLTTGSVKSANCDQRDGWHGRQDRPDTWPPAQGTAAFPGHVFAHKVKEPVVTQERVHQAI